MRKLLSAIALVLSLVIVGIYPHENAAQDVIIGNSRFIAQGKVTVFPYFVNEHGTYYITVGHAFMGRSYNLRTL